MVILVSGIFASWGFFASPESPWIKLGLQSLRRWTHEHMKEVFTGSPRALGAHAEGASRRVPPPRGVLSSRFPRRQAVYPNPSTQGCGVAIRETVSPATSESRSTHWSGRHKSALPLDIIPGKTTVAETSPEFDLMPAEIKDWGRPSQTRYGKCPNRLAGPALAETVLFLKHRCQMAFNVRAYSFFAITSFRAVTSRARSAYIRFKRLFSASRSFSLFTSDASMPPYLDFQA